MRTDMRRMCDECSPHREGRQARQLILQLDAELPGDELLQHRRYWSMLHVMDTTRNPLSFGKEVA